MTKVIVYSNREKVIAIANSILFSDLSYCDILSIEDFASSSKIIDCNILNQVFVKNKNKMKIKKEKKEELVGQSANNELLVW